MPAAATSWSPSTTDRDAGPSRNLTRPELESLGAGDTSSDADQAKDKKDKKDKGEKKSDKKKSDKKQTDDKQSDDKQSEEKQSDAQDSKQDTDESQAVEPEPKKSAEPEVPEPDLNVTGKRYTTVDLNVRTAPDESSKILTVLDTGTKVAVTATRADGFRQIVHNDRAVWVSKEYLSKKKPEPPADDSDGDGGSDGGGGGISTAACGGTSVESGLTSDAILVHRAICNRFPQVSSFGGTRASNDYHGTGQAVDAMISDSGTGWEIARWVRAHHQELGVSEVIYAQKIWTVQRSSEGWRPMEDRGSPTANHYDHVHVSVYGNSATIG